MFTICFTATAEDIRLRLRRGADTVAIVLTITVINSCQQARFTTGAMSKNYDYENRENVRLKGLVTALYSVLVFWALVVLFPLLDGTHLLKAIRAKLGIYSEVLRNKPDSAELYRRLHGCPLTSMCLIP